MEKVREGGEGGKMRNDGKLGDRMMSLMVGVHRQEVLQGLPYLVTWRWELL